ncbi:MAG: hypothetical protein R2747_02660 [Pyrinomonadaceae bacterium]
MAIEFGSSGTPADVITQPDNKIIMLSSCRTLLQIPAAPFCIVRLNEDSTLDTTFNNTGYTFTLVPGSPGDTGGATAAALQSDGKLVAVGTAPLQSRDNVVLIRYNSDGSLDNTFGTNGIATRVFTNNSKALNVVIQPDGKILIVGISGSDQFVARYNADGTLDNAFGTNGVTKLSIPGNSTSGNSIALLPGGKIITGGYMWGNSQTAPAFPMLARFNRNGTLDPTFDDDGIRTIPNSGPGFFGNSLISIAVQSDGRILALSDKNNLYRFNSDGSFDTGFDQDGSRRALNGTSDAYDLYVTPSGKITVVGNPTLPQSGGISIDFRIARFRPDGMPDPNFSDDGYLDVNVVGYLDGALGVTADVNGRIVIGGRWAYGVVGNPWETPRYCAARLLATPAQNVGFSGRVFRSDGRALANAHLTLRNGSELIGYSRTNPFGYFQFKNIPSNQTYTFSVNSKSASFPDRNVLVDDEINNYLIVAE